MLSARVIGYATSTTRHSSFKGIRLLVCEVVDAEYRGTGRIIGAGDWLGAGKGDLVLVTSDGDASFQHTRDERGPLRNVVVGLIDQTEEVAS